MEKKPSDVTREDLIAPCGMDCRLCYACIRDERGNPPVKVPGRLTG